MGRRRRRRHDDEPSISFEEFRRFFEERVSYKPGYTIKVTPGSREDAAIIEVTTAEVADSNDPLNTVCVCHTWEIRFSEIRHDQASLAQVARRAFLALEQHEVDEWVRVDGVRVIDPHAEDEGIMLDVTDLVRGS